MSDDMDGSSKWTSIEQGIWASGLCADASNQAEIHCPAQQSGDKQVYTQSKTASVAASTPECHPALHTAISIQQGTQVASEKAAMPVGSNRKLQLTFYKGLYHDIMTQSNGGIQSADLVFGANAGALVVLTVAVVAQVC